MTKDVSLYSTCSLSFAALRMLCDCKDGRFGMWRMLAGGIEMLGKAWQGLARRQALVRISKTTKATWLSFDFKVKYLDIFFFLSTIS